MKRMSEVFELPIDTGAAFAYGFNAIESAHKIGRCSSAQHAAHSINHIDALADALDALTSDIESNNNPRYSFECAVAALAAYRGEA